MGLIRLVFNWILIGQPIRLVHEFFHWKPWKFKTTFVTWDKKFDTLSYRNRSKIHSEHVRLKWGASSRWPFSQCCHMTHVTWGIKAQWSLGRRSPLYIKLTSNWFDPFFERWKQKIFGHFSKWISFYQKWRIVCRNFWSRIIRSATINFNNDNASSGKILSIGTSTLDCWS